METRTYNVFKYKELPPEIQEKAVEKLYDINLHYEWWDCEYEDAKRVGLKLDGFDLDRNRHCTGDFIDSAEETAEMIVKEHGKDCDSRQTAVNYLADRAKLVKQYSDGKTLDIVTEDNEYDFDNDCDDLDAEFLRSILEDYSIILQQQYEYLASAEAIIETIEANDYDFTKDGCIG